MNFSFQFLDDVWEEHGMWSLALSDLAKPLVTLVLLHLRSFDAELDLMSMCREFPRLIP